MHMTLDLIMNPVERKIVATIIEPDDRDVQVRLGPSDLSNQCEVCLGKAFLRETAEDTFGLKAWVGTAVHEKLEREEKDPFTRKEHKVVVGHVPGYGVIKGTCDRFDEMFHTAVDYKTADKKDIIKLKKSFVILSSGAVQFLSSKLAGYYVQAMLYGKGYEDAGHKVEKVAIFFLPRDSNRIADRWYVEFDYRREVAEAALKRAEDIMVWVQDHGLDELESDPDCYVCSVGGFGM